MYSSSKVCLSRYDRSRMNCSFDTLSGFSFCTLSANVALPMRRFSRSQPAVGWPISTAAASMTATTARCGCVRVRRSCTASFLTTSALHLIVSRQSSSSAASCSERPLNSAGAATSAGGSGAGAAAAAAAVLGAALFSLSLRADEVAFGRALELFTGVLLCLPGLGGLDPVALADGSAEFSAAFSRSGRRVLLGRGSLDPEEGEEAAASVALGTRGGLGASFLGVVLLPDLLPALLPALSGAAAGGLAASALDCSLSPRKLKSVDATRMSAPSACIMTLVEASPTSPPRGCDGLSSSS
mmetsp:Transcript_69352/g.166269  ORF Transcript_69352/g.166269 Transcript_69352/m.166269 type:complete len:298 (-) Transcript_69352:1560-2453(-)